MEYIPSDQRIQEAVKILRISLSDIEKQITLAEAHTKQLRNNLVIEQIKLDTLIPFMNSPVVAKKSLNEETVLGSRDLYNVEILRDSIINLVKLNGRMRSGYIASKLGNGEPKVKDSIHHSIKSLAKQGILILIPEELNGAIRERNLMYQINPNNI